MTEQLQTKGLSRRFIAEVKDLPLTETLERRMNSNIQKAVLQTLAEADFRGDFRVRFPFPSRTWGIIIEYPVDQYPWPLAAQDHTRVVRALVENIYAVRDSLGDNRRPSEVQILDAMLQTPRIEEEVKQRIKDALYVLNFLNENKTRQSAAATSAVKEIMGAISACNAIDEIITTLSKIESGKYAKVDGLPEAVSLAMDVLNDGRATIYSPEFYQAVFDEHGAEGREQATAIASSVGKEDSKGVVQGAVTGCTMGSLGGTLTLPGGGTAVGCVGVGAVTGVATGIGKSAAQAFEELIDWLF